MRAEEPHSIPVLAIPCTNCRWNARNIARIGSTMLVAPAITAPQGDAKAGLLVSVDRATGTVRLSLPCSTTIGQRKSFQLATNARMFRRTVGVTLGQYVTMCRVAEAQRLLLTTSLRVTEIAEAAGFGSLSSFYEHVSAACGMTPREYRRQGR